MIYTLPTSVDVNGKEFDINSDFRCILDIMEALSDPELTGQERAYISLGYFYPDFSKMQREDIEPAIKALYWFINGGQEPEETHGAKKLMDWQQDFPYIIGPVNKTIGHEIREDKHLHWWTFLSAYMDIGESLFSQIIKIRQKLLEGKRLDKAEKAWYLKNRKLVDLKNANRYSDAELEFMRSIKGGE